MTKLVLNQDQEAAALAIFQFLLSDDKEFAVSGPAGTGKTTLMKHVMSELLPEYEQTCKLIGETPRSWEIALTATTNKATEVLTQATGFPAQTIHSFLALKVTEDYQTGASKIRPRPDFKVHSNTLLFIDEASMVDRKLYEFLHKGTDATSKIIYLGDRCQMAPVHEKISPVYSNPKNTAELTIPVRNAGQPALMQLCDQLRRNVDALDFQPIVPVPGVIDHLDADQALDFVNQTFATEGQNARLLCYSNARVGEYNEYIRNLRGYPVRFVEGERVVNAQGCQINPRTMLRVEEEFTIYDTRKPKTVCLPDDIEMEVYQAEITNSHRGIIPIMLPVNPAHFREIMKHYARKKNWKTFFDLKNTYPDLRPKDSATVYKAQGSTYETVFLDLENLGKCTDDDQVARMLYVGASRATTRLVLYGQLPARFRNRTQVFVSA